MHASSFEDYVFDLQSRIKVEAEAIEANGSDSPPTFVDDR